MSTDSVLIRDATAADCPEIRRLLQELAEYEGMPNGVLINAKNLEEDGFGKLPFYKCLVAEDTCYKKNTGVTTGNPACGTLVGYVLYFYAFAWEGRTLYMEDICVTPSYQAKGLGSKLWTTIIKLGLEAGAISCRFCVLNSNASSIAFYKRKGAKDVTATKGFHFVTMSSRDNLEQLVARCMPNGSEAALHVRPAVTGDLPTVMEMKGHLAAEARLDLDTQLTLEELTEGLSSIPPTCHVMVAEGSKAELVGFALFTLAYSTWQGRSFFLQDLFVKSNFRKSGLGTSLVKASFQYCLSLGCSRCDFIAPVTNAPAIAYYQKLGAVDLTKTEGWLLMFMDKEAMVRMVTSDRREPLKRAAHVNGQGAHG